MNENTAKEDEMTKSVNPDLRPTTYDEWWALEEERDALRSQLASLIDLIRKRYPRLLERGNPLYDGVLARAVDAQAAAQAGGVSVSEEELVALRCLDDAVTINGDGMSTEAIGVDWEVARGAKDRLDALRAAKGGAT